MIRLVPRLAWSIETDAIEALDERLIPLLEAIAASRSLAAAVAECGVSYRAGWGLLRDYKRKLGAGLVLLERGRGASLTATGEMLLRTQRKAARRLARVLPGLAADIAALRGTARAAEPLVLRVAASHDLALAALSEALPAEAGLDLDVSFTGSLHAIDEFAEGRADIAGFHVPTAGCDGLQLKPFLKRLQSQRDRLIRFVDRDQGLILPHGNPKRIRSFRDIASKGLRFVNRQRGSGTRLLIDQLIADGQIDPGNVHGYNTEEFTHAAVAATVASGGADAGLGLRAAAAEYQLGFVPLIRERYFFVVRAKQLQSPAVLRFIDALKSPILSRTVKAFAGYATASAGAVVGLDALGASAKA